MMGPKMIAFFCLQLMLLYTGVLAQAPDVGRIFIGTQGNRSDPTAYTFNGNAIGLAGLSGLSIPFAAVVFQADGTEGSKTSEINVSCTNEFDGATGYTQLDFVPTNLPAAAAEGNVPFSLRQAGRGAVVRCYGSSDPSLQCPATNNQSIPQPQFCPDTSVSDPVTITLTPSPVASVCQRVIVPPRFTSALTVTGTFTVHLSEAVREQSVEVTCDQVDPSTLHYCQGGSCCTPNHNVSVTPANVTLGGTTATMSYTIRRTNVSGLISCVGVRCNATSSGRLAEGYFQYAGLSSSDSSSEGLLQSVTPELHMEPQYLSVYNTSFQSLLYVDTDINFEVQCQASVVSTLDEALDRTLPANIDCSFISANGTSTPSATTTPIPTTASSTHPSSPWRAVDSAFIISEDTKYSVVRTQRELSAIAPVQEVVVTTCCSVIKDADAASSAYTNLKVASVAVAGLVPTLNRTGGAISGTPSEERFIVNPAYREVAPCPCDLTYLTCDINCCCDDECTEAQTQTFSGCIPGLLGGQDPDTDLRRCGSTQFPKEDWFPLMCVEFESNALLGRFYTGENTVTSVTAVEYTYREAEPRFFDLNSIRYKDGSSILTVSASSEAGTLSLPQPSSSGPCLPSSPVLFLRETQSTCTGTLTPETCADLTTFSSRVYVQASSLFNPACPRSFSVRATGDSNDGSLVDAKVNYHCATNVVDYIKDLTQTFPDVVTPTTVSNFPSNLQDLNCSNPCGQDSSCLDYNDNLGDSTDPPLPPRCSYDNSFELPPTPTYNPLTQSCNNVVLEVQYRLSWANQTITGLTANVLLGSVSLASANSSVLSQKFGVSFVHHYDGPSNQTDNYQNVTTPYQRSGRPGYNFGTPVSTGCNSTNETSGVHSIDQSEAHQMAVFSPGGDGLCANARRRFLTFGEDVQSSCLLRLTIDDINDCDALRTLVLNHLNVLMPADSIGRYGYNNPANTDMWIAILRENPFPATDSNASSSADTPTPTPTPANTSSTANSTDVTTDPTVESTALPTLAENVTFDPLSVRGGVCRNVVSGIHLELMYAETGRSYGYPLREIIGAALRYTVKDWSLRCVGANSVRCQNNSVFSQPFTVSSSVQFTKVTPTTPSKPILFYQIHDKENCDSDTCYRFFEDFDTSVCHHDTCWRELFYPLTQAYQGQEDLSYTRGFSLLMALFVLGYVSVTRPWQ